MTSGYETQSRRAVERPSLAFTQQPFQNLNQLPCEPGSIIVGKYEVLRLIGTGGVGFVLAARHVGFDDLVALKFLRPEFASNQEAVSRFMIEARASFKLRSEHVARVLDVDLFEGTPFIAMELLDGSDLRSQLETQRLLPVAPAVDYVLQACEALAAAHAINVIHRDIKPENLFLLGHGEQAGHLKVLDFGISKVALVNTDRQTHQALTRVAVGTPPYMSPEQVRASSNRDARSDLWSLGCVLYELLTGTAPFDRISVMQSCAAVLEEEPAPARDLRPAIPAELSAVIARCLRKDAAERFNNVAELAEALTPFGSGRFATYPTRCHAHLSGEGLGRRSTPNSLAPISPRISGAVPALDANRLRSIAVRRETQTGQAQLRQPRVPTAAQLPFQPRPSQPHAPPAPPAARAPETDTPSELDLELGVPKRGAGRFLLWTAPIVIGGLVAGYFSSNETLGPVVRPAPIAAAQAPVIASASPAELAEQSASATPALLGAAALPAPAEVAQVPSESQGAPVAAEAPSAPAEPPAAVAAPVAAAKKSAPSTAKPKTTTRTMRPSSVPAPRATSHSDDPDVGF